MALTIDVKDGHDLPNTLYVSRVDGVGFTDAATDFLSNMFGDDVLQQFRLSRYYEWAELVRYFRMHMIKHSPTKGMVCIRMPMSLLNIYIEHGGARSNLSRTPAYNSSVCLEADKLKIDGTLFMKITHLPLQKIVTCMTSLLQDRDDHMIKTILMFGDVSHSVILQKAVKCAFQNAEVIVGKDEAVIIGSIISFIPSIQ